MAVIYSVGTSLPEYKLKQQEAKSIIEGLLSKQHLSKYLAVFDTAEIDTRYFSVHPDWFLKSHGLAERNNLFMDKGIQLAEQAIMNCIEDCEMQLEDIDAIITISSTGILTPSLDVHLMNRLPFRDDVRRHPFFGLGCAGGGIGLSRAYEYLRANPNHSIMVVAVELASVAFHPNHLDAQNIVGAALFADGAGSTVLLGEEHPLLKNKQTKYLHIMSSSSRILKNSIDVMGWDVKDDGFYVIFATKIPRIVRTFWKEHINDFLNQIEIDFSEIENILAHPGGRKVLEEIENVMNEQQSIQISKNILRRCGNMSSPTVLFVIDEALKNKRNMFNKNFHLISALGPGFSSELLLAEWK